MGRERWDPLHNRGGGNYFYSRENYYNRGKYTRAASPFFNEGTPKYRFSLEGVHTKFNLTIEEEIPGVSPHPSSPLPTLRLKHTGINTDFWGRGRGGLYQCYYLMIEVIQFWGVNKEMWVGSIMSCIRPCSMMKMDRMANSRRWQAQLLHTSSYQSGLWLYRGTRQSMSATFRSQLVLRPTTHLRASTLTLKVRVLYDTLKMTSAISEQQDNLLIILPKAETIQLGLELNFRTRALFYCKHNYVCVD